MTKYKKLENEETISYRENSQAPISIIAIHDHMSSSLSFEPLLNSLDNKIHVVAPCLRGMG